jgi:hypothetical protein
VKGIDDSSSEGDGAVDGPADTDVTVDADGLVVTAGRWDVV